MSLLACVSCTGNREMGIGTDVVDGRALRGFIDHNKAVPPPRHQDRILITCHFHWQRFASMAAVTDQLLGLMDGDGDHSCPSLSENKPYFSLGVAWRSESCLCPMKWAKPDVEAWHGGPMIALRPTDNDVLFNAMYLLHWQDVLDSGVCILAFCLPVTLARTAQS